MPHRCCIQKAAPPNLIKRTVIQIVGIMNLPGTSGRNIVYHAFSARYIHKATQCGVYRCVHKNRIGKGPFFLLSHFLSVFIMGDADIAEGNRAVISLETQGALGNLGFTHWATGMAGKHHIFMEQRTIQLDPLNQRVLGFAPRRIKPGGTEGDFDVLPYARGAACVLTRRPTLESFRTGWLGSIPTFVNAVVVAVGGVLNSPRV